jgi:hypothetical protein
MRVSLLKSAAVSCRWLAVVIPAMGIAACAASAGSVGNTESPASASSGNSASVTGHAQGVPLTAYWPSAQRQAELDNMFNALQARCMQGAGYNYPVVVEAPATFGADPGDSQFYVFGATSMSVASEYGYHMTDVTTNGKRHTASGVPVPSRASLSAAEETQLQSCGTQVAQETDQYDSNWSVLVQNLGQTAWDSSMSNPVVTAAFKNWSACMASKGFHYENPLEAMVGEVEGSSRADEWDTAVASSVEIQTAEADVACKQKTGLLTVWLSVLEQDQASLVAKNLPALQDGVTEFNAIFAKEQQLLSQAG